jgi:hypothetical protein
VLVFSFKPQEDDRVDHIGMSLEQKRYFSDYSYMGTQHRTVRLVQAFSDPFQQQHEASKLAGKKVSQSECATVFGINRNTLGSWLKQGCPYVKKAKKALGINWVLDTAAVAQWTEDQTIKILLVILPRWVKSN